jgi:ribosomal protein L37AE/L43A
MHEKVVFIDQKVLWVGSLNIHSHHDTSELMIRLESPAAYDQVGSFLVGRKGRGKDSLDLAQEENPQCMACGKPMIWNDGKFGIWFQCECGHKANAWGKPVKGKKTTQNPNPQVAALPHTPGKNTKTPPANSEVATPAAPKATSFSAKTNSPPPPVGSAKTPNVPGNPPIGKPVSTGGNPESPIAPSSGTNTLVSAEDRKAVVTALDKAKEALGAPLLSLKSRISQRRLEEVVLPVLIGEGLVRRVETTNGPRYIRG